jgi:predicted amidohydrolase
MPGSIAIWVNHSNIGENVRVTALRGAEVLLAPHQTGGCDSPDPHTIGLVDRALWENRHADPAAIEAELRGPKGRGWLMRWLPARAHDNGLFLVYSNGVGLDDNEIRTGNAMGVDPPLHPDVATLRFPDFGITRAGRAGC